MGILNIDFNNINLDDINYDEEDPDTIFLADFSFGILNLKSCCIPIDGGIFACQKMRRKK